jgi:hypothetical protein
MANSESPQQALEEHLRSSNESQDSELDVQNLAQRAEILVSNEAQDAPTDVERNRSHKLKNDNLETDINLKKSYAYWLIGVMIGQLLIMNTVFILVGKELIKYSEYILHLYISGTLLELFGLVLIITKYLFKE